MGIPTPEEWSVWLGVSIQAIYLVGFLLLAKTKAVWRDL
jgi:ABC-2 type transport system permease protein